MKFISLILLAFALTACSHTPPPVVVKEAKVIVVTPDTKLTELPKAPEPVDAAQLKQASKDDRTRLLSLKIIDLYTHISTLENQVLSIKSNIEEKVKRVKEGSAK